MVEGALILAIGGLILNNCLMYKQLCNKEDNPKVEEKEEEKKETIVEDNTEKLNQETLKEWFYGE